MTLTEKEEIFKNELLNNFPEYEPKLRESFFYYWSEPNKSKTKMRFELEKTWDTKRRLKTWLDNENKWNKNGTAAKKVTGAELNEVFAKRYSQGK